MSVCECVCVGDGGRVVREVSMCVEYRCRLHRQMTIG